MTKQRKKKVGRPKKEKTKVVRVPVGCLKEVKRVIKDHRFVFPPSPIKMYVFNKKDVQVG